MPIRKTPAARALFPRPPRPARAGALFVSALQRSAEPTAWQVRRAVAEAIRAHGSRGRVA
jgi:hypothetical protein